MRLWRHVFAFLCLLSATSAFASTRNTRNLQTPIRDYVPGEVMVGISYFRSVASLSEVASFNTMGLVGGKESLVLSHVDDQNPAEGGSIVTIFKYKLPNESVSVEAAIAELMRDPNVAWASPNYRYMQDMNEQMPDDTRFAEQYHHAGINSTAAWDITVGSPSVVVAVTDGSFDLKHPDLINAWYQNPNEVTGNGVDDDGNGYIDDVYGWDANRSVGDVDMDSAKKTDAEHSTHVAGIVAATMNNGLGVVGAAPGVRVMPIRFTGPNGWTSEIVARSYKFAADNGARIITTSYNVDGFAKDKTYLASLDYVYQKGLILFNSAGNSYAEDSPRQAVTRMVIVCATNGDGTKTSDTMAGYSNFGKGVDVCAPGGHESNTSVEILSTMPDSSYERMAGTSMASPNAAGVAALIWSQHLDWNRDQVVAQLLGTSDDIEAVNKRMKFKYGSGRVNSHRALTETPVPPRISKIYEVALVGTAPTAAKVTALNVRIGGVLDPTTANDMSNYELYRGNTNIPLNLVSPYSYGTNVLTFSFPSNAKLPTGTYTFKAKAGLADPFGQTLDGNGDGSGNDDFSLTFVVTE